MIYRLYFNRCEDFPQIWSIDEGSVDTEINVVDFTIPPGCAMKGGRAADFATCSAREPKAWVEIDARGVAIVAGVAVFQAQAGTPMRFYPDAFSLAIP